MILIEYEFSANTDIGIVDADESSLRYNLFLGNLAMKKGNVSIVMDWDWIPILDFAICLLAICENLLEATQGKQEFEFTESDEKITFERNDDKISIYTSFSDGILETSLEEFQKTSRQFYKDVIFSITAKNAELKNNKAFNVYLEEAERM